MEQTLLESIHSLSYGLYILLLESEHVPGNTDELREVLFTFCNDLSQHILGV